MNVLSALPLHVQSLIAFLSGSYFLYLMIYKADRTNRLAVSAFVLLAYGISIARLLKYLGYKDDFTWPFLLFVLSVSAILYLIGFYLAYTKGTAERKANMKKSLKTFKNIIIFTVVAFSIIYVLAVLGVLE